MNVSEDGGQGLESEDLGTAPVESQGSESQQDTEYSLASEYLSSIEDETQRALLAPQVKNWDAQVTRKFQEIHDQYKPYKELDADPDQLKRGYELMQRIQQNPQEVLNVLANAVGMDLTGYQQYLQGQQQQPELQQQPQQESPYKDYPEPLQQQFSKYDETLQQLQQAVEQMAMTQQQKVEQQTKAKQDYELDQTLKSLHEKHGEFDEEYVLLQMYKGVSADQAVANYQGMLQQYAQKMQQPSQQAPKVMGSGGAAPPPQNFDPGKASNRDVTQMVSSLLQANNQGS